MIPRSISRARGWIVCAASGLLLTSPSVSDAQSAGETQPQRALNSAVQREIDALGTSQPAATTEREPEQFRPNPPAPPTASTRTRKPTPLSRRLGGRSSRSRLHSSTRSARPTQRVTQVQYQTSRPTAPATGNSAVMSELQKLYAQDGRPMPQMNIPKYQQPPVLAQQAAPQKKPSLLKRIFSFGRKKKTAPVAQPPAQQPVVQQNRAPAFVPPAPAVPPAPQAQPRPQAPVTAAIPVPAAPATEPNPFEADESSVEIAAERTPAPIAPVDDFPDPFTDESETEADSGEEVNPFTGLTLDDAPASDADAPAEMKPIPLDDEDLEIAESGAELPELKIEVAEDAAPAEQPASDTVRQTPKEKLALIADRKGMTGLKGFCPVALRDSRDLLDTLPEHSAIHGLKTYFFSSADAKEKFEGNPTKYAPANDGYDIVHLTNDNDEVEGMLDFAAWYRGRLYLFSSASTKAEFRANPGDFVEIDEEEVAENDE